MNIQAQIDAYARAYVARWRVPGLSISVVRDGAILFSAGYGVQSLATGQPATADTLFHVASVAKTMTSAAIFQLRERRLVDLDDPIVQHLPYFKVDDARSDSITIRQCLMHTSGIGHPVDYGWDKAEFDDDSLAPRAAHAGLVATGYEQTEDGSIVQSLYPYNRMHVPCGCIASSASEMSRWMLVNLQRGELDGARILQASTYDEMWRMQLRTSREDYSEDPALGWWINRRHAETVMQHDGEDDGFLSNLRLWTESGYGVVMLCNAQWCDPWNASDEVYELGLSHLRGTDWRNLTDAR